MKKILIVDDSAFMRKVLSDLFASASDFEVVGTARNGVDALEKIKLHKPDVVTLDVEMPVMDGLVALEHIMRDCPVPVVMVSSLTTKGADATIRSLTLGAVDFIAKTKGSISAIDDIKEELLEKCRMATNVSVRLLQNTFIREKEDERRRVAEIKIIQARKSIETKTRTAVMPTAVKTPINRMAVGSRIVAIGTSTGGPRALQEVLTKLPEDFPCPIVIVQHMPAGFTKSLAERLDTLSKIRVKEAENGDILRNGCAYIAPGNYHMLLKQQEGSAVVIVTNQDAPVGNHRPAVDPMLRSVVDIYKHNTVGVILTGMGQDGAEGIKLIREQKGITIAEAKETAVVYGMPRVPAEWGVVDIVAPLGDVAREIMKAVVLKI